MFCYSGINKWEDIARLNFFPKLEEVKAKGIALLQSYSNKERRKLLLAQWVWTYACIKQKFLQNTGCKIAFLHNLFQTFILSNKPEEPLDCSSCLQVAIGGGVEWKCSI